MKKHLSYFVLWDEEGYDILPVCVSGLEEVREHINAVGLRKPTCTKAEIFAELQKLETRIVRNVVHKDTYDDLTDYLHAGVTSARSELEENSWVFLLTTHSSLGIWEVAELKAVQSPEFLTHWEELFPTPSMQSTIFIQEQEGKYTALLTIHDDAAKAIAAGLQKFESLSELDDWLSQSGACVLRFHELPVANREELSSFLLEPSTSLSMDDHLTMSAFVAENGSRRDIDVVSADAYKLTIDGFYLLTADGWTTTDMEPESGWESIELTTPIVPVVEVEDRQAITDEDLADFHFLLHQTFELAALKGLYTTKYDQRRKKVETHLPKFAPVIGIQKGKRFEASSGFIEWKDRQTNYLTDDGFAQLEEMVKSGQINIRSLLDLAFTNGKVENLDVFKNMVGGEATMQGMIRTEKKSVLSFSAGAAMKQEAEKKAAYSTVFGEFQSIAQSLEDVTGSTGVAEEVATVDTEHNPWNDASDFSGILDPLDLENRQFLDKHSS